jgi:DNA-binding transcriptional ArsR family regulator
MSVYPDNRESGRRAQHPMRAGRLLSEETVESLAAMMRVLADPTRIRLLEALNERGKATVSALASCMPLSQQGVSHQLGVLYQAGVVRRRREGVWVHYELCDWTGWWLLEQLAGGLEDSDAQPS